MKSILLALLIALIFVGEYSIGDMMVDPPLRYDGMGKSNSPIVLYDPVTDSYLYIPLNSRNKFIFEFQGIVYEIVPSLNMNIQVYRR